MTIQEIVSELEKLDVRFSLVTIERNAGLGEEQLHFSLDRQGMPNHPATAAWLLCRGIQRALDLCEYDPQWSVEMSHEVSHLSERLYEWIKASGDDTEGGAA